MTDNVITCIHPLCTVPMKHGQTACGKHWHSLPDELQRAISAGRRAGLEAFGAAKIAARDYLASKMIGPHDVRECRGPECRAQLVWLPAARHMRIPVDAKQVTATDKRFDPAKHDDHREACSSYVTSAKSN